MAERAARKIGQKARGACGTAVIAEADLGVAAALAHHARAGERRVVTLQVQQCRVDEIAHLGVLGRVRDLQYELAAVGGADPEVLVALARQSSRARLEPVVLAREADSA